MSWYKITLSYEEISAGLMIAIRDNFERIFSNSGKPREMALFADIVSQVNAQQIILETDLYFSPGAFQYAVTLIYAYSGAPCRKPTADSVALLVGHEDALELLK